MTYNQPDAQGLLAWLFRDRLIATLDAELDYLANDTAALTAGQRAKEDARLRAEILRGEREGEGAATVAAAAEGTTSRAVAISFRAPCSSSPITCRGLRHDNRQR